jgi:hypothetical protein
MQPPGFVDQLLDIHRNRHALGDAARDSASLGSLGDPAASLRREWISVRQAFIASLMAAVSTPFLRLLTWTVTLRCPPKSSEFCAIFWLLLNVSDHKMLARASENCGIDQARLPTT